MSRLVKGPWHGEDRCKEARRTLSGPIEMLRQVALKWELERGEIAGEFTRVTESLAPSLTPDQVLQVLRKNVPLKGYRSTDQLSITGSFGGLLATAQPPDSLSPSGFKDWAQSENIVQDRLLELAFLNPRWADHVEAAAETKGLSEAIWWNHSHTKGSFGDSLSREDKEWMDLVSERSTVPPESLSEGAASSSPSSTTIPKRQRLSPRPSSWQETQRFATPSCSV